MKSRPKKSPSSKATRKSAGPSCRAAQTSRSSRPTTALRSQFLAWRTSLPTEIERDTLLMPEAIAESVVQEAERFLMADLPGDFAARLTANAHYLYPRHKHFYKVLNLPGNRGRDSLYM